MMMTAQDRLSWKLALRNLLRNQRRSLSTGIAMTAGFIGLVLLAAYILRVQRGLAASAVYLNLKGHVSIYHREGVDRFFSKPKKFQISDEEKVKLRQIISQHSTEVEFAGEFLSGAALLSTPTRSTPVFVTGFEPQVVFQSHNHPTLQKWARDWLVDKESKHDEFILNPDLISITHSLAEILGKGTESLSLAESEQDVQLVARSYLNDLNAVNARLGVVHSTGVSMAEDTSVLAPLSLLQGLYDTQGIHYMGLFLREGVSPRSMKRVLDREIAVEGLELEVRTYDDEKISYFYVGTMGFLYVMGGFFVTLILSAVILSIVNSLTMGILERSKEIGTLRALGFQTHFVRWLFVKEAVWLSVFSVMAGWVGATVISEIVNRANIRFSPPGVAGEIQFFLATDMTILVVIGMVLIGTASLTAALVIRKKSNLRIVELLTDTGA